MIGLDANVLARYYVDDAGDAQAQRQRLAARRLIESGQALMVGKTVVLELEWVMRGYYGFSQTEIASVLRHLLGLTHVTVEDRDAVEQALANSDAGVDFADALHHAGDHQFRPAAGAQARTASSSGSETVRAISAGMMRSARSS